MPAWQIRTSYYAIKASGHNAYYVQNKMSLAEVIQWQAQYAIAEGSEIVLNRHTQGQIDKREQRKILNS